MSQTDRSLLKSYSHALMDVICCCTTNLHDQIAAEEEQTYYKTRSTTLPQDWIASYESPEKSSLLKDHDIILKKSANNRGTSRILFKPFEIVGQSRSFDTCSSDDTLKSGNITHMSSRSCHEGIIVDYANQYGYKENHNHSYW